MQLVRELMSLNESVGKRYAAFSSSGDGLNMKVCRTPADAFKFVSDDVEFGYAEIFEFSGEVLEIAHGGRGEVILNGERQSTSIFHAEEGTVYSDDLNLAAKFKKKWIKSLYVKPD